MMDRRSEKADPKVKKLSVRMSEEEKKALYTLSYVEDISISDIIRNYIRNDPRIVIKED